MVRSSSRIVCALLSVLMICTLFYGTAMAEEQSIEVNWFCVDNSSGAKSLSSDMEVWQELGVRNNMDIKIEAVPSGDLGQKFNLYMASGNGLPDVMQAPDLNTLNKFGMEGAFVALDEYLEKYAPNITAMLEKDPDFKALLTAADGHIYALGEYRPYPDTDPNPLIRQDWLDRLGLKMPTNLDEWYTVLKAFKEQDANGNGDPNDEIPYSGFFGGLTNFTEFFAAFGIMDRFYPNEDGVYEYCYIKPEMKESLTYINKLYAEGLIDPDIASNDMTVFDQKFDNDTVGAFRGWFFTSIINKNKLGETSIEGLELVGALPIQGKDGSYYIKKTSSAAGCFYGISASCKNVERVVKLLDYMWSEEGINLTTMGIEGLTFEYDETGYPVYTDLILNDPDGLGAMNALRAYGALNGMPYVHTVPYRVGLYPEELRDMAESTYQAWSDVAEYESITLTFTPEESSTIVQYGTDIDTYVDEMVLKYIYGIESLDTFDDFVSQVESMNVAAVLECYQAAYDRMMGN